MTNACVSLQQQADYRFEIHFGDNIPHLIANEPAPLGKGEGPKGRKSNTSKVLVSMAGEILDPKGFGRIRLRRVANDSAACVISFVQEVVVPGAQVRTDGSAAYLTLKDRGFFHQRTLTTPRPEVRGF